MIELSTDSATLRPLALDDLDAVFDVVSDVEVMRYVNILPIESRAAALRYVAAAVDIRERGAGHSWAVMLDGEPALCGVVVAKYASRHSVAFGGYLATRVHRQGFGLGVTQLIKRWALEQPRIFRIEAQTDVRNIGAKTVLERAGFKLEGRLERAWPGFNGEAPRACHQWAACK